MLNQKNLQKKRNDSWEVTEVVSLCHRASVNICCDIFRERKLLSNLVSLRSGPVLNVYFIPFKTWCKLLLIFKLKATWKR